MQISKLEEGREIRLPSAFAGGEGRYEDYVYLSMIEREWKRPILSEEKALRLNAPDRVTVVLLFWSYFETKIERLLRLGLVASQQTLVDDALDRYSSIGSRLDRFYRIVFGSTYKADLEAVGMASVWNHIVDVQRRRNEFMHGNPAAISNETVEQVASELKKEHESWISVYNYRLSLLPK